MYLSLEAIETTLAIIASCAAGSRLVATYNRPRPVLSGMALEAETVLAGMAGEIGEPFVSLFEPEEIADLVRRFGFTDIEQFGQDEAARTYFPGRADVRFAGAQRLILATVEPQSSLPCQSGA